MVRIWPNLKFHCESEILQSSHKGGSKKKKKSVLGKKKTHFIGRESTCEVYVFNQEITITTCSREQMGRVLITQGGLRPRKVVQDHYFSQTERSEDSNHLQTSENIRVNNGPL